MSKILITADNHGNTAWLDWLTQEAPKYNLVILAGDVLEMVDRSDRANVQIPKFIAWTKRVNNKNPRNDESKTKIYESNH